MTDTRVSRKLATIVALDVAGYSARIEADETKTTAEVAALRELVDTITTRHGGRVFNTAGDGFMLEFGSSLDGVEAALELAETCEPKVRVGVHLGDVVVQPNGDLLGHGVNIAARLMAQSTPGAALLSGAVHQTIRGPIADRLHPRGTIQLDKMAQTIEVYSFDVAVATPGTPGERALSPPAGNVPTRSDTISIAVIPFEATSSDPTDSSLSRGLSAEIGNALHQVARLRAIPSIAFGDASGSLDLRALAREWHAQYALTGSLTRKDEQFRILAQLISVEDGAQLWSATYDESHTDLFEIRKLIAESIVRQVGGEVMHSEYARISRSGPSNANAWALTAHSAHIVIERRGGPTAWDQAIAIVEKALSMAPDYGAAHARLSALCAERIIMLASPDVRSDQRRALDGAERAVQLSGHDPYALMNAAQGFSICGDASRARRMLKRSLQALPHDLLAWLFYWTNGAATLSESELPALLDDMKRTVMGHPTHPLAIAISGTMGVCYFRLGEFEQAKLVLQECFDDAPGFPYFGLVLAAIHTATDQASLARRVLDAISRQGFRTNRTYLEDVGRYTSFRMLAELLIPICEG